MKKVKLAELESFCIKALETAGVSPEHAAAVTDVLVTTDTFGVLTHGTKNLGQYIQKMHAGGLDAKAEPSIVAEGPGFAIINGNKAVGMVSAVKAMKLAIEKAKQTGIAYVGVCNSCHFGAAGYYANLAAREGLIGLSMSNADPVIAVPGGRKKAIGTNPFSFAAPLGDGKSVFLDVALSNVAALKVIMAQEKNQPIPDTWLVDEEGVPTTDAFKFPKNASLQPMGAHKGYGLAVLVELLASVMTGAGILSEVASWNLDLSSTNNAGHAFIAIDIAQMLPMEQFTARIGQMADELRNGPKAKGCERIFLPGEMEWDKREKALASGELELTDAMAASLTNLAEASGLELNLY
ncbi:MAG: Ldh family oxidoreductase [Oscillospiraceae bacterium]|nr:Ldh family oxidoreductase [Oscillospiraceae bacterium]